MTVRDIYILGAAMVGDRENDGRDERDFSVPYMNILLQEAFNCENSMRERDGQSLLLTAPIISSIDDEVPYHDELVRAAMPYGLAWKYQQEAGNNGLASQYRNMFIDAVNRNYCFCVRK